ncbi:MAG TPA: ketopantoate reductase family protein, partial [Candidatus Manganitrophaceae bacterium]
MTTSRPHPTPTKRIQKVLIVGAGSVGGYFGAHLFKAGAEGAFLVRPQTYRQIASNGLRIKSVQGDFTVRPPLIRQVSELSAVDDIECSNLLIILAVKCYDLSSVLDEIAPLVEKGALILTLQNGVDTEDRILSYFKKDCLVAGVAYITARVAAPGVIEHYRRGTITIGELSGAKQDGTQGGTQDGTLHVLHVPHVSERAHQIQQLLSTAGIPCNISGRIRKAKWEKLCWNATFNPLSVILDHPISLVLGSPP